MIGRPTFPRLFWAAATGAAWLFAGFIALDTLRAVVPLWSPLPWFDEWATVNLIRAWRDDEVTAVGALFSQHNEHRILVPRLVFLADDVLFRGRGYLSLAAIFAVQALHAGLFVTVLARARPAHPGRWAIAAIIPALMFSLRQAENFSSGFQLQFVSVFAGATLSFVLFGLAAARERQGRPSLGPLLGSFGAVLATTFTMANGLVAAYLLAVLALAAHLRPRTVVACAGFALILTAIYFHGYEAVAHHSRPSESLRYPLRFAAYTATYLGGIVATGTPDPAIVFGLAGSAATVWATVRTVRREEVGPGSLAMLGTMLFVGATAAITASGRLDFGVAQALSSRYVTGSAAFWAAQITYWWIDPPAWRFRSGGRAAVAAVALLLAVAMGGEQDHDKPQLAVQSFAENESANLLLLGLDDPAAITRAAWSDEGVQRLAPVLKADGLSIFGTADAASLGRPVTERGAVSAACEGGIETAVADPSLGPGGVRVSGRAADGPRRRLVRRVFLADAQGKVAGFASGAIPGAARDAWRGFALAPAGTVLTAYGVVAGDRLCAIGAAAVMPPQASQPAAAP